MDEELRYTLELEVTGHTYGELIAALRQEADEWEMLGHDDGTIIGSNGDAVIESPIAGGWKIEGVL